MYERMLNKENKPTVEEFFATTGAARQMLEELDEFMRCKLGTERSMRFPYGNEYGWSMKYSVKSKHICDVFAENGAFTVMLRLSDAQYQAEYPGLCQYTREFVDNRYPCGNGGWIHYRLLNKEHLEDIKRLLARKLKK